MQPTTKPKRVLSIFSIVMINIIAVDSLRNLAINAEYGFSSAFYYILGAVFFMIPSALAAAELATAWPITGGLYIWVREAFGRRWGLVCMWLQWIYNIVWFPTIMSFLAATFAYLIDPALAHNKIYLISATLIAFWGATVANCFGMRISSFVSTIGAIIGTLAPMLLIIILACYWLSTGHPSQISLNWQSFVPDITSFGHLSFIVAILFSLMGMEMSAVHAEEVKNPQRDYPRALLISTTIIIFSLIFSTLAIAMVIPTSEINLVSGLIEAFGIFFTTFHMTWMKPIIAICIVIGGFSGVSAWVIGPTKGLLGAARDGCLPNAFAFTNKQGAPITLLILQALICTGLCSVFILIPDINNAYWLLSDLTAQLALLVYLFLFSSALILRYKSADTPRSFKIPGGKLGLWTITGAGILGCVFAIIIGFVPPAQINIKRLGFFESFLIAGIVLSIVIPVLLFHIEQRRQRQKQGLAHG